MRKILSLLLALNLCAVPCPARSFDHLAPLDSPATLPTEAAFQPAGPMHDQVAAAHGDAPQRKDTFIARLRVDDLRRRQRAAAPSR